MCESGAHTHTRAFYCFLASFQIMKRNSSSGSSPEEVELCHHVSAAEHRQQLLLGKEGSFFLENISFHQKQPAFSPLQLFCFCGMRNLTHITFY